jgi:glycosyltransferase 2 family protein
MPELTVALLALIPLAAVELAKAARWRVLFGPLRPSYALCLRALVAGQTANALAPVRAGDAVQVGLISAQGGPLVAGAGALAGTKAIDTVCLGAIALAVAGASVFSRASAGLAAGLLVIALGAVLALRGGGLRRRLETNRIARKLRLAALVDVARAVREPRALLTVFAATAIVWVAGLAANAVLLVAAGLPPDLHMAARIIVAGYLVALFPSPPAQLGTFEAAIVVALTSAGVPLEQSLALAVSLHVCQFIKLGVLLAASLALTLPPARWVAWARSTLWAPWSARGA